MTQWLTMTPRGPLQAAMCVLRMRPVLIEPGASCLFLSWDAEACSSVVFVHISVLPFVYLLRLKLLKSDYTDVWTSVIELQLSNKHANTQCDTLNSIHVLWAPTHGMCTETTLFCFCSNLKQWQFQTPIEKLLQYMTKVWFEPLKTV